MRRFEHPGRCPRGTLTACDDGTKLERAGQMAAVHLSDEKGEPVAGSDNVKSGLAFRNIARRLRGEDVPLMELETPNGSWLNRLVKFFTPVRA